MSDSSPDTFANKATFGFELEFLALFQDTGATTPPHNPDHDDDPTPKEPPKLHIPIAAHDLHMQRLYCHGTQIARNLSDSGLPAVYRPKCHPSADYIPSIGTTEAKLGAFDEFRYTTYATTAIIPEPSMIWTDPTVHGRRMLVMPPTPTAQHFWLGFEAVSKTYRRHGGLGAAEADLETMCRMLRGERYYRVSVNAGRDSKLGSSRCGTHVHWGLGGQPYELVAVKRLLTLMWVVEETLMGLHAIWRQGAHKYIALLKRGTNMALDITEALPAWVGDTEQLGADTECGAWKTEMEQNVPSAVQESLHRGRPKIRWLWRAETIEELAALVGERVKSRRAGIAIVELLPANTAFVGKVRRSQLNTVEFRHMQGSLDPALVAAWVAVTGRIVEHCVDASPGGFRDLLERATCRLSDASTTNPAVYDLLGVLGVGQGTIDVFRGCDQARLDEEADADTNMFLRPLVDEDVSVSG